MTLLDLATCPLFRERRCDAALAEVRKRDAAELERIERRCMMWHRDKASQ